MTKSAFLKIVLASIALSAMTAPSASAANAKQGASWDDIKQLPDWFGVWTWIDEKHPTMPVNAKGQAQLDQLALERKVKGDINARQKRCILAGWPSGMSGPEEYSLEFFFTPGQVTMTESQGFVRRIYTDGRKHHGGKKTLQGDSVAHWEDNDLVVESNGYNDRTWLDWDGHPHTEALRITERYTRFNYGRMNVEITYTDPMVFPKPITIGMEMRLRADTEMLEFVCENEKDHQHMTAAKSTELVTVPIETLKRYVGTYDMKEKGSTFPLQITLDNGILYYYWAFDGRQPLTAFGEKLFSLAGTWIEFDAEAGTGPAKGVWVRFVEGEDYGAR